MAVKKVRDAIILSMLRDGVKSKRELENKLNIEEKDSKKSLYFLKKTGLVKRRRMYGAEYYAITDEGVIAVDKISQAARKHY